MSLLEVSGLKHEGNDGFELTDISFRQLKEERVAIAGETGSGKSTLLKCIAGLADIESGSIVFKKEKVLGPKLNLVPGHPGIAYLSQLFELPRNLRVEQVLDYANAMKRERADVLYQVCRIDHLLGRKTDQLSGGERQRIAIARLLSSSPDLLLLDEPFSHLDAGNKQTMKEVIWDICHKLKTTLIIVSHDPQDLLSWAQRILILQRGRLVQEGTPQEIYTKPVDTYVARLFGNYNQVMRGSTPFRKWAAKGSRAESILFRPECVRLSAPGDRGVRGKVERISYFGSHYELSISVGADIIIARTTSHHLKEGDTLRIQVRAQDIQHVG